MYDFMTAKVKDIQPVINIQLLQKLCLPIFFVRLTKAKIIAYLNMLEESYITTHEKQYIVEI